MEQYTSKFTYLVAGYGFISVHRFVIFFRTISQKMMQLWSPNLTYEIMFHDESRKNHLFWVQKVKGKVTTHKSQKQCQHRSWHSCECWLLLVKTVIFVRYSRCSLFLFRLLLNTHKFCQGEPPNLAHNVLDFAQIGSLSAELLPNSWRPF